MVPKANSPYALQICIFNIILFILAVLFISFWVYPSFSDIQAQKDTLKSTYDEYTRLTEKGMNFQEFIAQKDTTGSENEYLNTLIKSMTQGFYDTNIINGSGGLFTSFIDKKSAEIENRKKEAMVEERVKKLNNILPPYNEGVSGLKGSDTLSDFKFVNYVESLLYAFNLTSKDTIGITDVAPVEDFQGVGEKDNNQTVESNLFYIPLRLNLSGRKKDVIDFLHFIENVGTIDIEGGNVQFYSDTALTQKIPGVQAEGYNIYENQIFDIESLKMSDYLDSSKYPSALPLVDLVKKDQAFEKIDLEMQLRFYIKGLPDYLITKSISDTLTRYDTINQSVDKKIKQVLLKEFESSEQILLINSLRTLSFDLQKASDDVKTMRKSLGKKEEKNILYKKSVQFDAQLTLIENTFDKIQTKLDTPKK